MRPDPPRRNLGKVPIKIRKINALSTAFPVHAADNWNPLFLEVCFPLRHIFGTLDGDTEVLLQVLTVAIARFGCVELPDDLRAGSMARNDAAGSSDICVCLAQLEEEESCVA